jgi:hypothetical protein
MPSEKQSPLLRRLAARPPEIPGGVRLTVVPHDARHATVALAHGDRRVELRAAVLSVPYPSALDRLLAAEPDLEAVIVQRVPRGLAEAARRHGIAYLDAHGRGEVVREGFVYVAEPLRIPVAPSRSSPFAPTASRVVRALLADPVHHWRISQLASLVHLNPGNVHRALAALVDSGYVEREGDAYVLVDPGSLLEAWAEVGTRSRPGQRGTIVVEENLHATVERLVADLDGRAAVSGELAAELMAPHLPAGSAVVHCLDADAWERLGDRHSPSLDALSARAGRIVVDLVDEGVADFGSRRDGLPLVSPAQLYVDLARSRGRAREAAEELRRQCLPY